MAQELFVQNILPSITEDQIRELFADFGDVVKIQRPTNRETNEPRKFAFVIMDSEEAAAKAIEQLNGIELEGQNLVVREAEPRKPKKRLPRREVLRIGGEIAEALGETDKRPRAQIMRIIEEKDEEFARQLLADAIKKQEEGGVEINDGTRKRTLGGVFFKLAKDRLDAKTRGEIFPNWRELKKRRKERKARLAEEEAKKAAAAAAKGERSEAAATSNDAKKAGAPVNPKSKPKAASRQPKTITPEIEEKFLALRQSEATAQKHLADIQARRAKGSPIAALKELADLKAQIAQMMKSYPELKKLK